MNTFTVTLSVTIEVDADDQEHARKVACAALQLGGDNEVICPDDFDVVTVTPRACRCGGLLEGVGRCTVSGVYPSACKANPLGFGNTRFDHA